MVPNPAAAAYCPGLSLPQSAIARKLYVDLGSGSESCPAAIAIIAVASIVTNIIGK